MPHDLTVADVGEFGLINRLSALLGESSAVVGIGDDTAVIAETPDTYLLATVDMLVEDVHFRRSAIRGDDLGRRALAVNLSDIAAMAGQPTFALVSAALPPLTPLSYVEDVYRGLHDEAQRYGVSIVGGNTTRTGGPLSVDVIMLGRVAAKDLLLRRGAQMGDDLAVTGFLGCAAAARLAYDQSVRRGEELGPASRRDVVPQPRVVAGQEIGRSHLAHAMMDISDGLGGDVHHLAEASGVGAIVYEHLLPVTDETRHHASRLKMNAPDLALFGGEDYELLIALPPSNLNALAGRIGDLRITVVGSVVSADAGVTLQRAGGRREPLPAAGWQHF